MSRSAVLVAAIALAGCRRDVQHVLKSEPAAAAGRQATVSMIYSPGFSSLHSGYEKRVTYWLELTGPGGELKGELDHFFVDAGVGSAEEVMSDVPLAEFEAMKKTKPRVSIAADGHALAVSRDGGTRYRYVALDAGEKPLYCHHLTFGPDPSGDVWSAAPTTRDLVLGILQTRSGQASSPHFVSLAPSDPFHDEFTGAMAHACANDDAELRTAVVSAAVAPGEQIATSAVVDPLVACVAGIAKGDDGARATLVAEVAAKDPARPGQLERAALGLGATSDQAAQETLADALRAIPSDTANCYLRAAVAWSLASITANRGGAPKAVVAALAETARADDACPDALGGKWARVYAVRGLAAAGAEGTQPLRALAEPTCETPLASWPNGFDHWREDTLGNTEVPCWARAALAQRIVPERVGAAGGSGRR
jgi:hypothetical protein